MARRGDVLVSRRFNRDDVLAYGFAEMAIVIRANSVDHHPLLEVAL